MELKQIADEMQKAFADLNTALKSHEAEVKKFGDAQTETKSLIDKLQGRLDTLEGLTAQLTKKSVEPQKKAGDEVVTPEMKALEAHLRYGVKGGWMQKAEADEVKAFQAIQTKALSAGGDANGGIFTPEDFRLEVIRKIPNFANVSGLCNRQTTSKDTMRWPSLPYATDDISTSAVVVTWEDENESVTATEFGTGSQAIPTKKARALIKVPVELLEDTSINIIGLIADLLAEAFGIEDDKIFTNGSGPRRPEGFMTNADIASVNNGHATVYQYDGLMDFVYALPEQYAGNAILMFKRTSLPALRKIKDTTGQPLWQPSVAAGVPPTFAGVPYKTNEHMPAIASAAKPMINADFKRLYTIAERTNMTIKRLDELYAATDEVGFIARRRVGGKVVAPWAAKRLNMA